LIRKKRGDGVSESKKKFVASQQDWCCHNCKEKLKATFEVDHIIPLFKGGNNHIDNLRALCLECHRLHTISDKL
jgi:5-methylcytosine-specific restriction protein A